MARPIASLVVVLGPDGRVSRQGSVNDALLSDSFLGVGITGEEHVSSKAENEVERPPSAKERKNDAKLIVEEEVEQGHISWPYCKLSEVCIRNSADGP